MYRQKKPSLYVSHIFDWFAYAGILNYSQTTAVIVHIVCTVIKKAFSKCSQDPRSKFMVRIYWIVITQLSE